jgi:CheY-like chemotaxis protein
VNACTFDFYRLRIFVVEDHRDTLEALQIYLEQSGHIVLSASTKAEALKEIPMANCHVLISDINLPDGDGWELVQELRELASTLCHSHKRLRMKADCRKKRAIRFSPPSGQTGIAS